MQGPKIAPVDGCRISKSEIPQVLSEFLECINITELDRAIEPRLKSKRESPLIDMDWLGERFFVGLKQLLDRKFGRSSADDVINLGDFLFFARYYTLAYRQSDTATRNELAGKFKRGLDPESDLREFFYELLVCFAYASYGNTVTIVDANQCKENPFDFLVSGDAGTLEVEVKALSSFSGLPVKRRVLAKSLVGVIGTLRKSNPTSGGVFFDVCLQGRHVELNEIIRSAQKCVAEISSGRSSSEHGPISICSSPVPASHFDHLVSVAGNQFAGDRRPKSLSQHIMFALPPDPSCRVLVGVRFAEQWRPIRAVKKDLERGFKKFSGNSPAVLWLHFSDVYMPDLKRDGDAILDDPLLFEVLERYLRPGKYPYPSGIIISASVPVIPDPGNHEILFMPICLRFYPNMGSSFNHRLFMATRL